MTQKKKMLKLEPPRLSPGMLTTAELVEIASNDFIELSLVEDCEIANQQASKVVIERTIFRNVAFLEAGLPGIELTDVLFEKCDLSNIDFSEAVIHRTEFRGCKMIGANLTGATLRNVLLDGCLADYSALRFVNSKQMIVQDCSMNQADFSSAKLQKTEFYRTNIDRAQMSGTALEGIDLSDCTFDALGAGMQDLRGCIISRGQAHVFARMFGLVVKE